jgi:hypothetical protein
MSWNSENSSLVTRANEKSEIGNDDFRIQILFQTALKAMLMDRQKVHEHGLECNIEDDRHEERGLIEGEKLDGHWFAGRVEESRYSWYGHG